MEKLSPPPPEVAEAIRTLCQRILADTDYLTIAVEGPALEAQNVPAVVSDGALIEEERYLNRSDIVQWLTANVQRPGLWVEPYLSPRETAYIRDLAYRGITPDLAEGWRAAISVVWGRWVEECVSFCAEDPQLLVAVLDVSARSMVEYAFASVAAVREVSRAATGSETDADSIALIQLITSGAPVSEIRAEQRLRYRMRREHVGVVLWVDDSQHVSSLDRVISDLRSSAADRSVLAVRASVTSRWVWLSGHEATEAGRLERAITDVGGVRATAGKAGRGLEGFRSSHRDALAAQALLMRLGSERRFTAYADVELVDALTSDRDGARGFVLNVLGPLARADDVLRNTLLTYVQSGFSTTRAAARLYAHRNTVERRVARANELSTVTLEENPLHVGAALMVLDLAPGIVDAPDPRDRS